MWSKGVSGRRLPGSHLDKFKALQNNTFEVLDIFVLILFAQTTLDDVPTVAVSTADGNDGKKVLQREVWQFVNRQHSPIHNFNLKTSTFCDDLGILIGWLVQPGHIFKRTSWEISSYMSWKILSAAGWKTDISSRHEWRRILEQVIVQIGCSMRIKRVINAHWQPSDFVNPSEFDHIYRALVNWDGFDELLDALAEI